MQFPKHEPDFPPVEAFITRFFIAGYSSLIFEQETKVPIPLMSTGDVIEIFGKEYLIQSRQFGFNEDAFVTVYVIG